MKNFFIFIIFGTTIGFTLGTLTLLGPVRWTTDLIRARGWSEDAEATLIRCIIVSLVIFSGLTAAWFTSLVSKSESIRIRFGIPSLAALAALASLGLWFAMAGDHDAEETYVGSRFTFGSYPDEERLSDLVDEGYSSVISLLHPAVVPFETKLIAEERKAAAAAGLEFLHVPMLPWVSDNIAAREKISAIVNRGEGRYYVHCFLGKDRVRMVKHWVRDLDPNADIELTRQLAQHEVYRQMNDGMKWERGAVVLAEEGVFVTPQPVENEYVSYILPGTNGNVISLLDPDKDTDRQWIEEERNILESNGMELTVLPIPHKPYDSQKALEVVEKIHKMPGPKIVHAFLPVESGRSPGAEAFIQALRSGLPPLPPALFRSPMAEGPVDVLAPNIAMGPRPRPHEFQHYLYPRGLRAFIYVGNPEDDAAIADRALTQAQGLDWRAIPNPATLLERVASGGPWYLYGPGAQALGPEVAQAMGPAIPPLPRPKPTRSS